MKFFTLFWSVLLSYSAINISHASSPSEDDFIDSSKSNYAFDLKKEVIKEVIYDEYDKTFHSIRKTSHELEKSGCLNRSEKVSNNTNNLENNNSNSTKCSELFDRHLKQYEKLAYLTYLRKNTY